MAEYEVLQQNLEHLQLLNTSSAGCMAYVQSNLCQTFLRMFAITAATAVVWGFTVHTQLLEGVAHKWKPPQEKITKNEVTQPWSPLEKCQIVRSFMSVCHERRLFLRNALIWRSYAEVLPAGKWSHWKSAYNCWKSHSSEWFLDMPFQ